MEPPEDIDDTTYDIDPAMKIWKSMKSKQKKQYQMAEEDSDEMQHPSTEDLLKAHVENTRSDIDYSPFNDVKEPEHDLDKELERYLAPLEVGYNGDGDVHVAHSETEEDKGDLYHADVAPPLFVIPLQTESRAEGQGRLHLEPEEDRDHIYHADPPEFIPDNSEDRAAAVPIDWPSQRKYTEPEEDRDDMYHA